MAKRLNWLNRMYSFLFNALYLSFGVICKCKRHKKIMFSIGPPFSNPKKLRHPTTQPSAFIAFNFVKSFLWIFLFNFRYSHWRNKIFFSANAHLARPLVPRFLTLELTIRDLNLPLSPPSPPSTKKRSVSSHLERRCKVPGLCKLLFPFS